MAGEMACGGALQSSQQTLVLFWIPPAWGAIRVGDGVGHSSQASLVCARVDKQFLSTRVFLDQLFLYSSLTLHHFL